PHAEKRLAGGLQFPNRDNAVACAGLQCGRAAARPLRFPVRIEWLPASDVPVPLQDPPPDCVLAPPPSSTPGELFTDCLSNIHGECARRFALDGHSRVCYNL